jgi:hypothetical protein
LSGSNRRIKSSASGTIHISVLQKKFFSQDEWQCYYEEKVRIGSQKFMNSSRFANAAGFLFSLFSLFRISSDLVSTV